MASPDYLEIKKRKLKFVLIKHYRMRKVYGIKDLELNGILREIETQTSFKKMAKVRYAPNKINCNNNGDHIMTHPKDLKEILGNHFKNSFSNNIGFHDNG